VVTAGFGNLQTKQAVTPETVFQIGSVSKIYTATLAQILAEEGVLDLEEKIVTYLPDFTLSDANAAKQITVRQCLSHQGGFEGDIFEDQGLGDDAVAKSVATAKTWKQWVQPGELWFYNNAGFYIVGRIIEVLTGKTFEAVMKEKLLVPAGLHNTTLFTHEAILHPHAVGHNLKDRKSGYTIAQPYAIPRHAAAAGYIIQTVGDLLRFAQLHLNGGEIDGTRILSEERVKDMQKPQIEAANFANYYGTSWALEDIGGATIVQHGGSTNGFRAHLDLVPEGRFAVAVLTNGSPGTIAYDAIRRWALEHYRNLKDEPRKPVELPREALAKRVGIWERKEMRLEITLEDDGLAASMSEVNEETGKPVGEAKTVKLYPLNESEFGVVDAEGRGESWQFVELHPDSQGNTRDLLRFHGRLVERAQPGSDKLEKAAKSAKSGKADKPEADDKAKKKKK
jgi:CubicO group peptidase (beta-lactamase class C family)